MQHASKSADSRQDQTRLKRWELKEVWNHRQEGIKDNACAHPNWSVLHSLVEPPNKNRPQVSQVTENRMNWDEEDFPFSKSSDFKKKKKKITLSLQVWAGVPYYIHVIWLNFITLFSTFALTAHQCHSASRTSDQLPFQRAISEDDKARMSGNEHWQAN